MLPILTLAVPPLMGAIIGYVTNYVAIRMLFRPLRAWRALGFRLPLTPGVIPSQRMQLAENMGAMVGEHLLTGQDVRRALMERGFQQELRQVVAGRLTALFQRDLGPLASLIPDRFQTSFQAGVDILRWRFLKHLHGHLSSPEVRDQVGAAITAYLEHWLNQPLHQRLAQEHLDGLITFMEKSLANLLASPSTTTWVHDQMHEGLKGLLVEKRSLRELLPEDFTDLLLNRIEQATPDLLAKLADLLQEPAIQAKIARALGNAAINFVSSLGPVAGLLGGFLKPETIAGKILGFLQRPDNDLARLLLDDTVQERLAALLRDQAAQFLDRPTGALLTELGPDNLEKLGDGLAGQATALLGKPGTASLLAGLCRDELQKRTGLPLREVLAGLVGEAHLARGAAWISDETVAMVGSATTKRLLDRLLTGLVEEKLLSRPLGPLADFLPKAVLAGIEDFLLKQTSDLLEREVPGLLDAINVRRIVTRKVDSLDLLRLEGLLLSIMQEQFKYINLFGALLGFIIGCANLLFLPMP
ncbi:MAG: hypothetical protein COX17_05095 [Deltaproteobacteria bacterium CG23_combo_of_CG06-09_8_20_14_all_60_8]|nr:MAG: hypothetical protein COX17_05095 [Deltaproteobacteria bacterium CG23_combo_of_CG06-09_8_20_14_all_60_8]